MVLAAIRSLRQGDSEDSAAIKAALPSRVTDYPPRCPPVREDVAMSASRWQSRWRKRTTPMTGTTRR